MIAKPARPPKKPLVVYDMERTPQPGDTVAILREDIHPRGARPRRGRRVRMNYATRDGSVTGTIIHVDRLGVDVRLDPPLTDP